MSYYKIVYYKAFMVCFIVYRDMSTFFNEVIFGTMKAEMIQTKGSPNGFLHLIAAVGLIWSSWNEEISSENQHTTLNH